MNELKLFRKTDAVIAAAVLCVCAVLLLVSRAGRDGTVTAQIICDGEVYCEYELSAQTETFTVSPKEGVVITFDGGSVFFSESGCKGKQCISAGRLTKAGQSAVCLPENVLITLKGKSAPSADAITY